MRRALVAALVCASADSALAQPPTAADAGGRIDRILLTSVLGGGPSPVYQDPMVDCELVALDGHVRVECPQGRTIACSEITRRELTPAPGVEIVLGCGVPCDDEDGRGTAYSVVAVVSAAGPLIGIATTPDSSCGSVVRIVGNGPRFRLVLTGGGEDGFYRATYGYRGGHFEQIAIRYDESNY